MRHYEKRRRGTKHEHLEQFNLQTESGVDAKTLGLARPYRKLVAIRSPQNLFMLVKALAETDPETTDVVVMTAKALPSGGEAGISHIDLDSYDQHLMTAVVERAERAGKKISPLIVPTNNPLHAVLRTAKDLAAQELILGASNKFTAEEQLDLIAFYWIHLHDGQPTPLTVRILSRNRDVYFDLEGGNRIPKISERRARSVAELRAAGIGVERVLLAHDGTSAASDLFQSVITMLDPEVVLDVVALAPGEAQSPAQNLLQHDRDLARQLGRELRTFSLETDWGPKIIQLAQEGKYHLIILSTSSDSSAESPCPGWIDFVLGHAHCPAFLAALPVIPTDVEQ